MDFFDFLLKRQFPFRELTRSHAHALMFVDMKQRHFHILEEASSGGMGKETLISVGLAFLPSLLSSVSVVEVHPYMRTSTGLYHPMESLMHNAQVGSHCHWMMMGRFGPIAFEGISASDYTADRNELLLQSALLKLLIEEYRRDQ